MQSREEIDIFSARFGECGIPFIGEIGQLMAFKGIILDVKGTKG